MTYSAAYISALAVQLGGIAAFLGGFAATFLGTLLALNVKGRISTTAIGFSAASSVLFIMTVVASTAITAMLHPEGPKLPVTSVAGARAVMGMAFLLGLYALLVSLGLSGWARSRGTGWTTSIAAGVGLVAVTALLVSFGV